MHLDELGLTISLNDLSANLTDAYFLFVKVVGHQCFADADAAVLAVFRFKATVQTFVALTSVAVAVAG